MMHRAHRSDGYNDEEEDFRRIIDSIPPPTPPDGGWGWMVVFASFMINAIVDGFCYSFGILLPEFTHHFNINTSDITSTAALRQHTLTLTQATAQTRYPTATISFGGALLLGTYMLSGPMSSALCNKFGSRSVAFGGCALSFMSLFLCQFADGAPMFLILFGLCTGIGFGMMFLAAIVIVGFYFEERRSIAATLAMCGSGAGISLMAPLITHLLEEFEWKGGIVLLSGVVLQALVLASLYRPLDADLRRRKKIILKRMEEDRKIGPQTCLIMQRLLEEKKRQRTISTGSMNNVIITRDNLVIRPGDAVPAHRERKNSFLDRVKSAIGRSKDNVGKGSNNSSRVGTPKTIHKNIPNITVNGADTPPSTGSPFSRRHMTFTPTPSNLVLEGSSAKSLEASKSSPLHGETSERSYHSVNDFSGVSTYAAGPSSADTVSLAASMDATSLASSTTEHHELINRYKNHTPEHDRPMYRKDILYTGSIHNLPQYNNNIEDYVASITQVPQDYREQPGEEPHCCLDKLSCLPKSIRDVLLSILDTSTFKSPTFVVLSIASFLTMLGYFVPFVFLPVYARSVNIEVMDVALLLSILGGANTFGRLVAGALGGKTWVDALIVNNVALVLAGGATVALPFCDSHYLLVTFAAVFGLCVAAFSSLRSQIVVELMGLDKLTTAFGQLIVLHGIAVIIGTPLAGLLYDLSGSFDYGFYASGSVVILSGIMCFPLRKISEYEKHRAGRITPSTNSSLLPVSSDEDHRACYTAAESPL